MTAPVQKPLYGGTFQISGQAAIPFAIPGEQVDAAGRLTQLSPARVEPGCVHFGSCGGCHYQHADYSSQLTWKLSILNDLAAEQTLTLHAIEIEAAEPWHYRNRIRLRVQWLGGNMQVGYSLRGSNVFLPVVMCPISTPLLWRAAEALIHLAGTQGTAARWLSAVVAVELFCNHDQTRLQVGFFLAEAGPDQTAKSAFSEVCRALQAAVPELAGAGAVLDPELGRRQRRAWAGAAWGAAGLIYSAAGREYWVTRGAFFQVNRFLVDRLAQLAAAAAGDALAWDLFAGVGLFSRLLAEHSKQLIAVEGSAVAAADLLAAGRRHGFTARHMPVLDFLREQEFQRERPGLVVLDPPRAGLGPEGAALLARIGPAAIVYVSCDPVTLMRDLAVLIRGGYRLERVHLMDLFPQTYHLESVVFLRKT